MDKFSVSREVAGLGLTLYVLGVSHITSRL